MIPIPLATTSDLLTLYGQYDEQEEERRRQTVKLEKLQNAELLQERSTAGMSHEEEQKNQSFAASLTTKVGRQTLCAGLQHDI